VIGIVFSKDRALQLDAFLRSFRTHVSNVKLRVLVKTSSLRHYTAYQDVFKRHPWATQVWQSASFKDDVLDLLPQDEVVFFVDDQVFIRTWSGLNTVGLSLRLDPRLTKCYTMNCEQLVPSFEPTPVLLRWRWDAGQFDWAYPLSVDGHVFDAKKIADLLKKATFTSPNTMEASLQALTTDYLLDYPFGFCYREAKVVNVPLNKVQLDFENRHAGGNVEDLLISWERGQQLAIESLYDVVSESAHQELPVALEVR
jgi:hypothetical protein